MFLLFSIFKRFSKFPFSFFFCFSFFHTAWAQWKSFSDNVQYQPNCHCVSFSLFDCLPSNIPESCWLAWRSASTTHQEARRSKETWQTGRRTRELVSRSSFTWLVWRKHLWNWHCCQPWIQDGFWREKNTLIKSISWNGETHWSLSLHTGGILLQAAQERCVLWENFIFRQLNVFFFFLLFSLCEER